MLATFMTIIFMFLAVATPALARPHHARRTENGYHSVVINSYGGILSDFRTRG